MNKKTDNMDMDNAYMRAEQKRQETERHATRLKEFLIYGADIPGDIQKQYGFSEDYRLYKELEEMDFTDVHGSGLTKKELLLLESEKDKLNKQLVVQSKVNNKQNLMTM